MNEVNISSLFSDMLPGLKITAINGPIGKVNGNFVECKSARFGNYDNIIDFFKQYTHIALWKVETQKTYYPDICEYREYFIVRYAVIE